jgi:hypothetical protein
MFCQHSSKDLQRRQYMENLGNFVINKVSILAEIKVRKISVSKD